LKPEGTVTRGTTNPNRLRRIDNWIGWWCGDALRAAADPVVVDLGYGATPITAIELRVRLSRVNPDVRVIGLEIDPERVRAAQSAADPPWLEFRRGGFELAGLRPTVIRAFNVLRQYSEADVVPAWAKMTSALQPGGWLIEGTCDELGRIGAWLSIPAGSAQPATLTLSARLTNLDTPATIAERLPKALIHHNVPGEPIHNLISTLDDAWHRAAGVGVFGVRQRWLAAVSELRQRGWRTVDGPRRWRLGEVTLPWPPAPPHP